MRNLREVSEREIYLFIPLQENPAKLIAFPSNWEKGKNKIPFVNSSVSLSLVPLPKEKFKNTHLFRLGKPTVVVAGIKEGRRNGTRRCDKVFGQISWKKVKHFFFTGAVSNSWLSWPNPRPPQKGRKANTRNPKSHSFQS